MENEGIRCAQQPTSSRSSRTLGHSCKLCNSAQTVEALRESYAHTEKAKDGLTKPGKTRTVKSSTTKLFQPDKLQGQFCSLESGSGSHGLSIPHRSAVANLMLLQHVWKPFPVHVNACHGPLVVTIEDVAHDRWSQTHQATESRRPFRRSSELVKPPLHRQRTCSSSTQNSVRQC